MPKKIQKDIIHAKGVDIGIYMAKLLPRCCSPRLTKWAKRLP